MRAEAHYVDLLASRAPAARERTLPIQSIDAPVFVDQPAIAPLIESIRRHGVLQPLIVQDREGSYQLIAGHKRLAAAVSAGLREVPCIVHDVDDEKAEELAAAASLSAERERVVETAPAPAPTIPDTTLHAGRDLAHSLTTLTACADMLTSSSSELSRAVVANLIRAEAARAASLLYATRVVRQEVQVARTAVLVQTILDRASRSFEAERRVRAVGIEVTTELPRGTCLAADEALLAGAIGWASVATLAILAGVADARLAITAAAADGQITFAVSQDLVSVNDTWRSRAFDPAWTERAGGVPVLVSLLAVQRAAAAHGGHAVAELTARGTRVALTVPLGT